MHNAAEDIFILILGILFVLFNRPFGKMLARLYYGNEAKAWTYSIVYMIVGWIFICFSAYSLITH